jgi:hypothetical protein
MKYILFLFLFSFLFSACDMLQKKETEDKTRKKKQPSASDEENEKNRLTKKKTHVIEEETKTNSEAQILNNIVVHESGELTASRVYLVFADRKLVPKTNHVGLGTAVYLVLQIKDGWKVKNGLVSLDASEKIVTNNGEVVSNATSLFKTTPLVKERDASQINLKAGIAETRPDIDYYIINYRLWDKNGEGEIKGSYKLYINAETK